MSKKGEAVFRREPYKNKQYKEIFLCWKCGNDVEVELTEPKNRIFCEECFEQHKQEYQSLVEEYARLKIEVMFEIALRIMEKSKKVYMHEYHEAAERIHMSARQETEKYMSSHEMIVAIMLKEYGFEYQVNMPILTYKVDFYIPELKVCLEVDGDRHNLQHDSKRDIEIRAFLGADWEIVRIPIKYIEQNPARIIDGVEGVAKERRRLRTKHNGIIPQHYSKIEDAFYKKVSG